MTLIWYICDKLEFLLQYCCPGKIRQNCSIERTLYVKNASIFLMKRACIAHSLLSAWYYIDWIWSCLCLFFNLLTLMLCVCVCHNMWHCIFNDTACTACLEWLLLLKIMLVHMVLVVNCYVFMIDRFLSLDFVTCAKINHQHPCLTLML